MRLSLQSDSSTSSDSLTSDPTRSAFINLIARQTLNLNSIVEKFDVSRQSISFPIKILIECGLITIKSKGRERYCVAELEKLVEVSQWIEQYRIFWANKLDALEIHLADKEKIDGEVKFGK